MFYEVENVPLNYVIDFYVTQNFIPELKDYLYNLSAAKLICLGDYFRRI